MEISVVNKGNKAFYFVLLDISSDGTVTVMYPKLKKSEALGKGPGVKLNKTTSLRDGCSRLTDCLKVIATDQPRDFRFVEVEGSQSKGTAHPLTRLLEEAAGRTKSRGSRNVGCEDWATAEVTVEVVKTP